MNTKNLWNANRPRNFWLCEPDPTEEQWQAAVLKAAPLLGLNTRVETTEELLQLTLGEGQFGPNHWRLPPILRLYYHLKPLVPRLLSRVLRKVYSEKAQADARLDWPVESRYVRFLWEVMRQLLIDQGGNEIAFRHFWPAGHRFAFVLTHDVETFAGQAAVRDVVAMEEKLGFRSSWNFVPERYALDHQLIADLEDRGFEIGLHGWSHDGKLFNSHARFARRAKGINRHLDSLSAVGFRAPLMHRQPYWMQSLDIEYDLSFFDTDPFEPIPGGVMTIWPFMIGRFVELPYTLVQDYTLHNVLGESTPRLWLQKVEFIERYSGMALVNTHPDYLKKPKAWRLYVDFLEAMKERRDAWHALPRDVARWWVHRSNARAAAATNGIHLGRIRIGAGSADLIDKSDLILDTEEPTQPDAEAVSLATYAEFPAFDDIHQID